MEGNSEGVQEPRLPPDIACILENYERRTGVQLNYAHREPFPDSEGIDMHHYQAVDANGRPHELTVILRSPPDFAPRGVYTTRPENQPILDAAKRQGCTLAPSV